MPKLPRIKGRELLAALRRAEFVLVRGRGSQHFMQLPAGRCTVVPGHGGETVGPGLLRSILRDVEMSVDEFESRL